MPFKVKPEIRVLALTGIPVEGGTLALGVVYRGSLWVDGVVKGTIKGGVAQGLNRMVKRSNHYGQVRVLMLDGDYPWKLSEGEFEWLAEKLSRPLIVAWSGKAPKGVAKVWEGLKISAYGLSLEDALAVVRASTVEPPLPEALRLARLLAEAYESLLRHTRRK